MWISVLTLWDVVFGTEVVGAVWFAALGAAAHPAGNTGNSSQ